MRVERRRKKMAKAIRSHNLEATVAIALLAAFVALVAAKPAQAAFPDQAFPDGHNPIAFENDGDIWVASKMHLANLTPGTADSNEADPSVSPDGRYVAFAGDRDGDFEIYTANIFTGEIERVSDNSVDDSDPAWSFYRLGYYPRITSEVRQLGTRFTAEYPFVR